MPKTISRFSGLKGSDLKLIAIVTMFIDHMGAFLIEPLTGNYPQFFETSLGLGLSLKTWSAIGFSFRLIGRLAFPIFTFLLVEGFKHTRNPYKYLFRLSLFAFLSEIPFDLALSSKVFDLHYQNVFFTLALGLGLLIINQKYDSKILKFTFLSITIALSTLLKTDYSWYGIILIYLFYTLDKAEPKHNLVLAFWLAAQMTAPLALFPLWQYNGQRGLSWRYVFYLFYPLHLLFFYFLRQYIINALI